MSDEDFDDDDDSTPKQHQKMEKYWLEKWWGKMENLKENLMKISSFLLRIYTLVISKFPTYFVATIIPC
jgi:hypothetical protein